LSPETADLSRRAGFQAALNEEIFLMLGITHMNEDIPVHEMEAVDRVDQMLFADDRGGTGRFQQVPVEKEPYRHECSVPPLRLPARRMSAARQTFFAP